MTTLYWLRDLFLILLVAAVGLLAYLTVTSDA
jgi:hypothetical protein